MGFIKKNKIIIYGNHKYYYCYNIIVYGDHKPKDSSKDIIFKNTNEGPVKGYLPAESNNRTIDRERVEQLS